LHRAHSSVTLFSALPDATKSEAQNARLHAGCFVCGA